MRVLIFIGFLLLVCSIAMSLIPFFAEEVYANPACPTSWQRHCSWHGDNWVEVLGQPDCCCPPEYTGPATCL